MAVAFLMSGAATASKNKNGLAITTHAHALGRSSVRRDQNPTMAMAIRNRQLLPATQCDWPHPLQTHRRQTSAARTMTFLVSDQPKLRRPIRRQIDIVGRINAPRIHHPQQNRRIRLVLHPQTKPAQLRKLSPNNSSQPKHHHTKQTHANQIPNPHTDATSCAPKKIRHPPLQDPKALSRPQKNRPIGDGAWETVIASGALQSAPEPGWREERAA
jgi:hypothetical protein